MIYSDLSTEQSKPLNVLSTEQQKMCETCIHKVTKSDIDAVYNQAIEDALSVVEWDGYTFDIKRRIEQLIK